MTAPPPLVDRAALARNRARAVRQGLEPFLLSRVADEIEERLGEVNRTFSAEAVVTGFPDWWAARRPRARVVADDDVIGLEPQAHDLVIHALSLHWANDPVGQLVQCLRALRPDGLFLCASFGGSTLSELRTALAEAEVRLTGGLSPRVLPMGEIRDMGALLQRAGFALPVADSDPVRVSYASLAHLIRDLRAMGEGNALSDRASRTPPALFPLTEAIAAEAFATGGGRIGATFEVIYLTGWAPGPNQQKPLRPGSAAMRLADALAHGRASGKGDA